MIEKRILYAVRSSVLPKMTYVYDQKPQVFGRFNPVTGLLDICIDHWNALFCTDHLEKLIPFLSSQPGSVSIFEIAKTDTSVTITSLLTQETNHESERPPQRQDPA